ncbi:tail fiber protein [Pectobacterium parvum]|uniref:Phage tail protein n=2 Tax=Pectobacterium parvum TaxID=2778550 RepID=A0ABW8G2B6_9GAMM|nr:MULTISPECIES: tail fiber protein [Pectobacterium]UFK40621.1 tail fiber protein [Pectobacterium parvum]UVD96349.1 tail fiber protein [Pectobacterium parvum]GKW41437.1 microcystin dependent protein [Pectobacterium carotovorum subsp. carotovorum]
MKKDLKSYLCMAATGLSLFSISQVAQACSNEDFTGSVCFTAATYCPNGFLEANGQLLQVNEYQALYSVVGVQYGGDGRTNFGIPDLRGRSPVGQGQGPGLQNVPQGLPQASSLRGAETATLTVAQMPVHSHLATFTPTAGSGGPVVVKATTEAGQSAAPSATNNQLATPVTPAAKIYAPEGAASTQVPLAGVSGGGSGGGGTVAVGNNGGSQPVKIIPPQTALRACIVANGYYPPRP